MQTSPTSQPAAIEMRGITKRFGGFAANDGIDFTARAGEVHALLGENGAGKSTLMSILAGLYRPDAGTVAINGAPVSLRSPGEAIERGIGMVYQHFMLVDSFSVAENIMLGQRHSRRAKAADVAARLSEISGRYGLKVDPAAYIWQLSIGERQRVEILRLLERGARILIFDEPTAVLTPQESRELIRTLRQMAAEGFCIVFISHKLDEVLAVADQITVLRQGRVVATVPAAGATRQSLASLMVGREIAPAMTRDDRDPAHKPGPVVLELAGLEAIGDHGLPALKGIDLTVRAGEIVGLAGVAGNGQRELAEVVAGLRPLSGGALLMDGRPLSGWNARKAIDAGVAHIPEDRSGTGLIGNLDLADNLILKTYRREPLARGPLLDAAAIDEFAGELLADYKVVAPGPRIKAAQLSGGNQQKLLLARELSGQPRLLIAVHPTRGIDIGATETIHRELLAQRARGAAILLISEDLDELLLLADRIAVIYEGLITGVVDAAAADLDGIGLLMAGGAKDTP